MSKKKKKILLKQLARDSHWHLGRRQKVASPCPHSGGGVAGFIGATQ